MDSLPEQHLDSLPSWKREEVHRQVGMVCAYRIQGMPEDKVAEKAKFVSVEDMYFRLKRWGLAGLVPVEKEELPGQTPEKKARGSGEITDLPPAANAMNIFRGAIEKLSVFVE